MKRSEAGTPFLGIDWRTDISDNSKDTCEYYNGYIGRGLVLCTDSCSGTYDYGFTGIGVD